MTPRRIKKENMLACLACVQAINGREEINGEAYDINTQTDIHDEVRISQAA
jgi:hypothetical protein